MKNFLSFNNVIHYIFAIFVIANLVACYFLFQFGYKYVYKTFYTDESSLLLGVNSRSEGMDLVKFEKAIRALQDKTGVHSYSIIKNQEDEEALEEKNTIEEDGENMMDDIEEELENEEDERPELSEGELGNNL